jgi:broad-specificity NMP kinase
MGRQNVLIEGLSGTGKTSVCDELQRRGYEAIHGDRELAYQGNPRTGEPLPGTRHEHHIWNVERVRALAARHDAALTFFCGGSRNFDQFIELFDEVIVLKVDFQTLTSRLDKRSDGDWAGGKPTERERIERWVKTGEEVPRNAIEIDGTEPLAAVADAILRHVQPGDTRIVTGASQSPGHETARTDLVVSNCGDYLHLDQLVRPAEDRHALQRARGLVRTEGFVNDLPDSGEVVAGRRGHKHPHEDDIGHLRARSRQSDLHVLHTPPRLSDEVTDRDRAAVGVEWACAREEN